MKHIVALSGGKDSTALALRLAEVEPREYLYVCTPTGKELPEMFAHWRTLREMLGSTIYPIMPKRGFDARIEAYNTLPNARMRWCTRELKIEPMKAFLVANGPCVHYVGLRADEEEREGIYGAMEGVEQRYPLREWGWTKEKVYDYLAERGVEIPDRTDCDRCFFQTIAEWYLLWRKYPELYAEAEAQEEKTGHTFRSESRDTWPAALKGLREEFERGRKIPNLERFIQGRLIAVERRGMCRVCTL